MDRLKEVADTSNSEQEFKDKLEEMVNAVTGLNQKQQQ